jgi:hypothetical protein
LVFAQCFCWIFPFFPPVVCMFMYVRMYAGWRPS